MLLAKNIACQTFVIQNKNIGARECFIDTSLFSLINFVDKVVQYEYMTHNLQKNGENDILQP